MIGQPDEEYEAVRSAEIRDGDEIIVEHMRWEYKRGTPVASEYYRTMAQPAGRYGERTHKLRHIPSVEWPSIAPWQLGWIWADTDGNTRFWRRKA